MEQEERSLSSKGGKMVKYFSYHVLSVAMVLSHILIIYLSTKGSLFPGGEVLQSIVGTCAEIIAGLYGVTLASYTFFLSRMDALTATDMTLDYIVASMKNRFKYLIWYITGNVIFTLFISVFLMYCPVPTEESQVFFYRLFCNEFVLFIASSIILILWYAVRVIDPNCLEKEARKIKNRISRSVLKRGDAMEFLLLYDKIVTRCNELVDPEVLEQLHRNKGSHFALTLELIRIGKLLPLSVFAEICRIHRYYECTVNCRRLEVSMEMCLSAKRTLEYLEKDQINT